MRYRALMVVVCAALGLASCAARPVRTAQPPDSRAEQHAKALDLFGQGQRARGAGNLDRAIECYRMSIANNPDLGAVWNNLGLALMDRGTESDFVASGQAFTQAASLLPRDATPYRNLGVLYDTRGFAEDALKHFESALAVNEYDIESLRGATRAGKVLHKSDPAALDRLRRAQMVETDPAWREIILRERIRVEADLKEAADRM